jgi:hypothetical protein
MLDQKEKLLVIKPFVVAYEEEQPMQTKSDAAKPSGKKGHLTKENATREVLARLKDRVKKI